MNQTTKDAQVKTEEPTGFPSPGDVFEERYRIDALIGSGGFAKVYRATQVDLGREVALKIMMPEEMLKNVLPDSSSEQGHKLAERFMQEARVVAKLRDPNTITMHDHGRSEAGLLYMVFEYIDGVSLSRLVKSRGPIDPRRVAKILRQTLSSLQEAHAMGMLHRDVKPANIMIYEHVGRPDQVKVLDFGIAKVVGRKVSQDLAEDLTTNGALLGTPRYMSPEQIRGDDLTPATDIYSLGLVAYEMLTGKKAIDSNSSVIIIGAQLDPRPFAVPNQPHIPPQLRQVVNRMLFKEREMRYQKVDEVLEDLNRVDTGTFQSVQLPARTKQVTDRTGEIDLPDISDSLEPLKVAEAEEQHYRSSQRRKLMIWGTAIFVFASVTGIGGALLLQSMDGSEESGSEVTEKTDATETAVAVAEQPPIKREEGVPRPDEIIITTTPPTLNVFVNGEPAGKSPVTVNSDDVSFPATIRAELDPEHSRTTVLDSAVADVNLDLSMFAQAEANTTEETEEKSPGSIGTRPKVEKETKPRRRPRKRKSRPAKKKVQQKKEEPAKKTTDKKDEDDGFTLPALDY